MVKLVILYAGTIFLAWLSQQYNPLSRDRDIQRDRHFMRDPMDAFTLIIVAWLTLFSGLRTSYNDTANYINSFRNAAMTLSEHMATSEETGLADNPLFYISQVLVKGVVNNYHVWFLLNAFVCNYTVVKFLRHYAHSYPLAVLLYHAIGTYVMYIAAVKQSIAVAAILWAVPFALKGKWVRYYLLVCLAMLFHTHAFMLLILPLLMGKPWGKMTWAFGAAALFAMATYDSTLGAFMRYAQSIGANVAEIEVFDNHSINFLRVVVYGIPPLIALFFRQRLFEDSDRVEDLMVNMTVIGWFILSIGLVEGGNLFARMAAYFEWASAITLPWMIYKLFNRQSRKFIFGCAGALYSVYFLYEFMVSKDFGNGYASISFAEFLAELRR